MAEEKLYPPFEARERLRQATPSDDILQFADTFAAIASALDACPNGDDVTLWLSTCRNEFMTTNAIYYDLRLILGDGKSPSAADHVKRPRDRVLGRGLLV